MKYFISVFFLFILLFSGCKKNNNPTGPSNSNPQNSANISTTDFLQTPTGGDPRGVYSPNSPLIYIFFTTIPNITIKQEYSVDKGSGTLSFTGSSPDSGSYSADNLSFNVTGKLIAYQGNDSSSSPITYSNTLGLGTGKWSIISQGIMLLDNTDSVQYAVNNKGLFLLQPLDVNTGVKQKVKGVSNLLKRLGVLTNYGTIVIAFKK